MGTVPTRPAPRRSDLGARWPSLFGLAVAATVFAIVIVGGHLTSAPVVDRITVVNPTVYQHEIDAVGVGRSLGVSSGR